MTEMVDLFRVEDDLGLGPYISSNWRQRGGDIPEWVFDMQDAHANYDHPTPQIDGLGWPDGLEVCALRTQRDLAIWFMDWEEKLAESGFFIATYRVEANTVRYGRSAQALFRRPEGLKPLAITPIWM